MAATRVTRSLAYAWVVLLAVVITGPALLPGFTLSYDLVFTPRQDLLPGSLGVGGGLPRAVPQDAVVAVAEMVVPGELLEKLVLLAIPLLVGLGMLRLLRGTAAGVVAATLAIVNAFVAQRLVIGHWGFLLAYALLPWALVVAARLRARGDPWDGVRLLLLVAAASLTPSGSLLMAIVAVPPALLPGSAYSRRLRALLGGAVLLTWVPWLLPALLHPAGTGADPDGTGVFAMRTDAPGGPLVSALTGGGIWNAEVVLASRGTVLTWFAAVAILGLAAAGFRSLQRSLGQATTAWWTGVAVAGLVAALASALLPGPWGTIIEVIPGGGLARDAHKLLAPWVLLVAAAAGSGAALLAGMVRERSARIVVVGAMAVLPVAFMPDMLWGMGGRWQAVDYPDDWSVVRTTLEADIRPGDVVSFPWTAFRRFDWNGDRTMLDPAPRWLPRTTVVADNLAVATPSGVVDVSGDDPRARIISDALASGESLGDTLTGLGIGWALVARGTPGPVPTLTGWSLVVDGDALDLYAAPSIVAPAPPAEYLAVVAGADAATVLLLLGGVAALGIRRVRVHPGPRLVP
jgi:hypothetical protein